MRAHSEEPVLPLVQPGEFKTISAVGWTPCCVTRNDSTTTVAADAASDSVISEVATLSLVNFVAMSFSSLLHMCVGAPSTVLFDRERLQNPNPPPPLQRLQVVPPTISMDPEAGIGRSFDTAREFWVR